MPLDIETGLRKTFKPHNSSFMVYLPNKTPLEYTDVLRDGNWLICKRRDGKQDVYFGTGIEWVEEI